MPHILTPSSILEAYAANQLQEERDALCLFVDIAGFTPLTSALMAHDAEGAEVLAQVLADIFTPLLALVDAQGGYVAGFAGDAFKAIFPGLNAESHQRAVTTAWQIREQMATHPMQRTRFGDFRFAVKITIASGPVEWRIWRAADNSSAMAQQAALLFGGSALAQALAADPLAQAGEIVMTAAVAAQLSSTNAVLEAVADHFRLCTWSMITSPVPPPATHHSPLDDHFFPPEIRQRQTQGEFRQVVTLFVNLQALPSGERATSFAATLFRLLAQYGGYLCRIGQIGDRDPGGTLLLFWGAPTSHENDVARALHFALALQAAAPTPIRIGITTALAYAGFVGSPLREEYTCYGVHVNLAARQMVMAGWGEIWLDEETARLAGAAFTITAQATLRFKGFADERTVYRLLHHQTITAETFYSGRLVGRAAELAQLHSALAPLAEGKSGGLITIIGEAGMGKSRLVYELQRRLENRQEGKKTRRQEERTADEGDAFLSPHLPVFLSPQWFHCQTDEILRQPLNPFRYWLRSYFNQSASADEATNKAAFTVKLDDLLTALNLNEQGEVEQSKIQNLQSEITRTRSFLGALVDLYWPDALYAQVEPELRLANTLAALKSLILAESLRRPVILHLEDAHWLDADSQSFLARLRQNVGEYPLAVIVTQRPAEETRRQEDRETGRQEDQARLGTAGAQLTIRLTALTVEEIRALATAQLQGEPAPTLVDLLVVRAEGNPFFVEQLLRYLQEEKWLIEGPAGWQLRHAAATPALLPDGVRALLVARLDRLPQAVKEVVQTAAVLGREFDTQVLVQMLAGDTTLPDKLAVADRAAIWSAITPVRYLFRHALLREAAYEMQLRTQLRSLHQRATEALQALFAERLDPYATDLAYHYDRAEMAEQAALWYGRAGEQAASSYANQDALHYFSRALALTPSEHAATRFTLLLGREAVYDVMGKSADRQHDLQTLLTLAESTADEHLRTQAALRNANHLQLIGDYDKALLMTQQAIQSARQANNQQLISSAYRLWGRVLWLQGDYTNSQKQVEHALQLSKANNDHKGEAECLIDLGAINFYQGYYATAPAYYDQALAIYALLKERKGEISALAMLGTLGTETGDYGVAVHFFQQALEKCRAIGYAYGEAFILGNLGMNYIYVGEYTKAEQCLRQAITSCTERGDRQSAGVYLDSLAVIQQQQGAYLLAATTCQQALVIQQALGDRRFEAYSLAYLGDARRELGDLAEAMSCYEQALSLRQALGEESLSLEIRIGIAQLAMQQARIEEALTHVNLVLDWIATRGIEGIEFPVQLYLNSYKMLKTSGKTEDAAHALMAGYTLLQQRAARLQDEQLRQTFLKAVPFNRELLSLWQQVQ